MHVRKYQNYRTFWSSKNQLKYFLDIHVMSFGSRLFINCKCRSVGHCINSFVSNFDLSGCFYHNITKCRNVWVIWKNKNADLPLDNPMFNSWALNIHEDFNYFDSRQYLVIGNSFVDLWRCERLYSAYSCVKLLNGQHY